MEPPAPGGAAGSRRLGTARPPAAARPPGARTTTARRERAAPSRGRRGFAERREIPPRVRRCRGVLIVVAIAGAPLAGGPPGENRLPRLVHESGVPHAGTRAPRSGEEIGVDRRADPCASHATIMPPDCRAD